MAIRRAAVIVAALVGMIPAGPPAYAADPKVTFNFNPSFTRLVGGGWVAGSFCQANAITGTPTQVAISTQVTCAINGTSRSAAAPGDRAAVVLVVATTPPVLMCATGKAVFMETEENNNKLILVTAGPHCVTMPT